MKQPTAVLITFALVFAQSGFSQSPPVVSGGSATARPALPPLPNNLPSWLRGIKKNHIFYKQGRYNYDIYNIKRLAYDLNAVAVGHAMAYEDMVTGKGETLETDTLTELIWG